MESNRILNILREVIASMARGPAASHVLGANDAAISEVGRVAEDAALRIPVGGIEVISSSTTLDELGVGDANIAAFAWALRLRLGGIALNIEWMYRMQRAFQGTAMDMHQYKTVGDVARHIQASLHHGIANPLVVYVDDEEENLFVFKRKYGKRLNLKTFADSREAFEFIRQCPDVVLVLTDEAMPGLTGNALCDAVHETRPMIKFILITGNPGGDENLMHRSLRHGRFYDFLNKPLDFEAKGEEYFVIMKRVLDGNCD